MTERFQRELLDQILASEPRIVRRRRRRRQLRVLAVAAVTAAVITLSGIASSSRNPVSADVVVTVRDGRVIVQMTDAETSPDAVSDGLERAGIDARVRGVPVGPSVVGRFVAAQIEGDAPVRIEYTGQSGSGFSGFSLPVGWSGRLVLSVGVPARAGEDYAVSSDAFSPGEPLHCRGVLGEPLGDAVGHLPAGQIRVATDAAPDPIALASVPGPLLDWRIARAEAFNPRELLLRLVEPTASVNAETGC